MANIVMPSERPQLIDADDNWYVLEGFDVKKSVTSHAEVDVNDIWKRI